MMIRLKTPLTLRRCPQVTINFANNLCFQQNLIDVFTYSYTGVLLTTATALWKIILMTRVANTLYYIYVGKLSNLRYHLKLSAKTTTNSFSLVTQ